MSKTPKLRFKEFSGDWESKKLHQVADVLSGKRVPKGMSLTEKNTGIPYITVSDMGDKYVDTNNLKYITSEIEDYIKKYKVYTNDIIISVAGTLGKINLIQHELENANLTENCDKITNLRNINYKYLYYYLNTENIQNQISSVNTISSQPKLALACIRGFDIFIPNLEEQEKIASFFSLIDEKISLQGEKVEALKGYKKGMMQKIFSRELRFKGFNQSWKCTNIGSVCEVYGRIGFRGYTTADIVSKQDGVISLSPSNIVDSKLFLDKENTYISKEKYLESPEIMIYNNDIVFVKTGSTFGKVALVENLNEKATLNPQLVVLKNITIPPKLLSTIISSPIIQRQVQGAKGGGVVPTLTQKEIKEYKFYIPQSKEEQEKIANMFQLIDDKINKEQEKLDSLKQYKNGLLQQMFV